MKEAVSAQAPLRPRITPARLLFAASLPPAFIAWCAPFAAWGWFPDLCLHLSLLAVVCLIPALIVLRRDAPRCLVMVIASLCGLWPWLQAAYAERLPLTQHGLRLVSTNVYDFNERRSEAITLLRDLDVDLIAMQEVWPGDEAVLAARWPYVVWHHDRGLFASALVSRHPLLMSHLHALEEYVLVEALVSTPQGPLRVFVVHLASPKFPQRSAMRARQLQRLAELVRASREPVVIAGDFNLSAAAPAWSGFCEAAGVMRAPGPSPATWPHWLGPLGLDLDHVAGRGVALAPLSVLDIPGSDHRAVLTRVELSP